MEIDDPKIIALREQVTAAQQEFNMAVMFHETWKPAAYDGNLHSRMGQSYASQAFLVARIALRREMVLALMRLWDTNTKAVRTQWIASALREQPVIDALAKDRVDRIGLPEAIDQMKNDLGTQAAEAVQLINKYMEGGSHAPVLKKLLALRHERLVF
ncbi:AbiU2 domain-containing protein, partial [Xanthobacter agilis]|uniref:AbiU2 domain-containing protein n=1 Tax=Xanthobacter agilis TaxID=47492 RepID=UPI003728E6B0